VPQFSTARPNFAADKELAKQANLGIEDENKTTSFSALNEN